MGDMSAAPDRDPLSLNCGSHDYCTGITICAAPVQKIRPRCHNPPFNSVHSCPLRCFNRPAATFVLGYRTRALPTLLGDGGTKRIAKIHVRNVKRPWIIRS